MSNPVLEKLKSIIDFSVISQFDIADLTDDLYIPLCISKENVYVVVTDDTNQDSVKKIVNNKLNTENVVFRVCPKEVFEELIHHIENITNEKISIDRDEIVAEDILSEQSNTNDVKLLEQNTESDYVFDNINNIESRNSSSFEIEDESDSSSEVKLKYDDNNLDDESHFNSRVNEHSSFSFDSDKQNSQDSDESAQPRRKAHKFELGQILLQMGLVTQEQIFNALVESKNLKLPLGTMLVQQGIITIDDLKKALSMQQGFETVTSDELKISDDVLSYLPDDFIRLNKVLPIKYDDKSLVVAMVNPNDKKVINDIIYLTGLKPKVMLITHYEFSMSIQKLLNEQKKSTSKILKKIEKESSAFEKEETLFEQAQKELKDDSNIVVKFVNKIISDGIDMNASDIHIEPRLNGYSVRYRKDGILREMLALPAKTESAILTRLKVISKMNIAEHRRPQDGSFSITYKNKDYDFRINTLPVGEQEKMVIRILAPAVSMSSKKDEMVLIGATNEEIEQIKKMESVPNGIILATGPTGSGKTTTLYTLLKAINDEKVNITTIEDPIEIRIDGINQSQINTKAGITFASCMRAILRQDPDVILVGEIRDLETLETAISAALTGHLVLSTIHTNSAASTITRLIDMGAKDYLVSSTLVGIIAQRLVRGLCPHCKTQYFPSREEAELVIAGGEREIQDFMKTPVYKNNGCVKCNFEGYVGRIGVYEIMSITKEIKRLIAQGAHDIQIEEAAMGTGMKTLHQACLHHIVQGNTTISEFLRVLGPVKE